MYLSETSSLPISLNGIEDTNLLEDVVQFRQALRKQLDCDGPTDVLLGAALDQMGIASSSS